jgi:hypothetical protein
VPNGFVHNRTFGDMQLSQIIRHIRAMVFAERDWSGGAAGAVG